MFYVLWMDVKCIYICMHIKIRVKNIMIKNNILNIKILSQEVLMTKPQIVTSHIDLLY